MTSVGGSACARFKSEKEVYPILERAKIDRAIPLSLGFYHTEGCHFPITIDRYGNQLKEPRNDYQGIIDETTYLMTVVADFLDTLRSRGLYDNSAIIITADHGTFHGSMDKKLPARVSTLLWVKPEGATEPYRASSLPTSSQKISVLAKALLAGPLNQAAIDGILEAHDRVYIGTKEYHGEFFKYVIDDDNNVVSCEALGFSD
jgi:arylsulfatase A-like enzyme